MASRKKIKVKNEESLVRDSFSKAILNTDKSAYVNHRLRKKADADKSKRIHSLEEELASIKAEQANILKMVQGLLKKS